MNVLLSSMEYPMGLTMDPSKGGLAIQGADPIASQHCLSLTYDSGFVKQMTNFNALGRSSCSGQRSQAYPSTDSGTSLEIAESDGKHYSSSKVVVNLNNGSGESKFQEDNREIVRGIIRDEWMVDAVSQRDDDANNERVCHVVEAIEGTRVATVLANEWDDCNVYQDNSSSSEQTALKDQTVATGKRKSSTIGRRSKDSTTTSNSINIRDVMVSDGNKKMLKCLKTGIGSKGTDELKLKAERSTSEHSGDLSPRSLKASSKLHEYPKQDFIHVRARRGQATDSHSLAERVRREKISERMKFLQDLVPGCSKVTGKAVMLDEIINYVQSLQRQIEFLSMKLAAVDPRLDLSLENLLNKESQIIQARSPETTLMGPDPLAGYRDYQSQLQMPPQINHYGVDIRTVGTVCDALLRRSMTAPVPAPLVFTDDFVDPLSQTMHACDGDLQTIVQMGNGQIRQGFSSQGLHGTRCLPTGQLKVEY